MSDLRFHFNALLLVSHVYVDKLVYVAEPFQAAETHGHEVKITATNKSGLTRTV